MSLCGCRSSTSGSKLFRIPFSSIYQANKYLSNRRLDNKFNIAEGVTKNFFFIGINFIMVGAQVLIMFIGGRAFNIEQRLNGAQWGYSIVLGFLSIPVGALIRCVPNSFVLWLVPDFIKNRKPKGPELMVTDEEEQFRFPQPLSDVKEELSFLKRVKGGRLNNLKFRMQDAREHWLPRSRSGSRSRNGSIPHTPNGEEENGDDSFADGVPPPTPETRKRGRSNRSRSNSALGATTVMAGIIAGSVAGWSPIERGDAQKFMGRGDLDNVEVHPDTKPDDRVITENPHSLNLPPSQIPEITPAPATTSETLK